MILITDGGSTKCDWILLDSQGAVVLRTRTVGLNPAVVHGDELLKRVADNLDLQPYYDLVTRLDFYGAGCGTEKPSLLLKGVLEEIFPKACVDVQEDTIAAVYAATTLPGIVCILGTGSNSSYFDGTTVHPSAVSLGYSLMDEASGNYFGKRLLRDYFYNKMPAVLKAEFARRFDLTPDVIKHNVYKHCLLYTSDAADE